MALFEMKRRKMRTISNMALVIVIVSLPEELQMIEIFFGPIPIRSKDYFWARPSKKRCQISL